MSSIIGLKLAETTAAIQFAAAAKILKAGQAQGDAALKLIAAATESFDAAVADVSADITTQLDCYA
ncbi:MAG TPA: hypothetical protein VNT79_05610 [Phycisphaerae bacterium]|nr:hypothetical protein [Phycisphaerae bacterium]